MFIKRKKFSCVFYFVLGCGLCAVTLYFIEKSNKLVHSTVTSKNEVRVSNCSFPNVKVKTNIFRLVSPVDFKNIILHGYAPWDLISRIISQRGNFEPHIDKAIYYFLTRNPSALFIDIGANIGIRSLQVAKYDRKVIAIEALQENVFRLCSSIKDNEVSDQVVVIHNAIAERHKTVQLGRYKDCMGCSFLADDMDVVRPRKKEMKGLFQEKIPAITLDDLLKLEDVVSSKGIFIKIDIEGYEHHVFDGAHEFFKSKDVIGVIMEWTWHRGLDSALRIVEFMRKFSFLPFRFNSQGNKYVLLKWMEHQGTDFPDDILWLSTKYVYQVI